MPELLDLRAAPRPFKLTVSLSARDVFDLGATALARRVKAGTMTPSEFEAAMRELVADLHTASYAAGRSGNWDAIEPDEWRRIEAVIERQFHFLRGFRDWIAGTEPDDVSEAGVYQRARLYGAAASQSFERGHLADLGLFAELPAYPGDGTTDCRSNCKCRWAVTTLRKAVGDFNVSWRLGRAEHCRQCRKRSTAWKSLQVRGGALVSGYEVEGCFR